MRVVRPLRVVEPAQGIVPAQELGLVGLVLQHEMDLALGAEMAAHAARQLAQDVGFRRVDDRVHGVEPQAVEAVLLQPVERVVDEVVAHGLLAEVDRGTPRRLEVLGEEAGRVEAEIVTLGPEVVVDHVEEDHQAEAVRLVDRAPSARRACRRDGPGHRAAPRHSPSSGCPAKSAIGISSTAVTPSSAR